MDTLNPNDESWKVWLENREVDEVAKALIPAEDDSWKLQYIGYLRGPFEGGDFRSLSTEEFLGSWTAQMQRERQETEEAEAAVMSQLQKVVTLRDELMSVHCPSGIARSYPEAEMFSPTKPSKAKSGDNRVTDTAAFMGSDIFADLEDGEELTEEDRRALRLQWKEEEETERAAQVERLQAAYVEEVEKERSRAANLRKKITEDVATTPVKTKQRKGGIVVNLSAVMDDTSVKLRLPTVEDLEELDRQRELQALEQASAYTADAISEDKKREDGDGEREKVLLERQQCEQIVAKYLELHDEETLLESPVADTGRVQTLKKKKKKRRMRPADISAPYEARERYTLAKEDAASQYVASEVEKRNARSINEALKAESEARNDIVVRESRLYASILQRERQERKAVLEWIIWAEEQRRVAMVNLVELEARERLSCADAEETAFRNLMENEGTSLAAAEHNVRGRVAREKAERWASKCQVIIDRNNVLFTSPKELCLRPIDAAFVTLRSSREQALRQQADRHRVWASTGNRPPSSAARRASKSTPLVTPLPPLPPSEEKLPTGIAPSDHILNAEYITTHTDAAKTGRAAATLEGLSAISNLAPCGPYLTSLDASGNKIRTAHPELFESLPRLKECKLNDNLLSKLETSMSSATSPLEALDVSMNQLSSVAFCRGFPELTTLLAVNNNIDDLSGLQECARLSRLDVYRNNVKSLTELGSLSLLSRLNAGRNAIKEIAAVSFFPLLTELLLFYNQIADIPETLSSCVLLQQLFLNNNLLCCLPPRAIFHPLLTIVNVAGNELQDISALSTCLMLETLDASFNKIRKVEAVCVLWPLRRLRSLNLADNPLVKGGGPEASSVPLIVGTIFPDLQEYNTDELKREGDVLKRLSSYCPRVMYYQNKSTTDGKSHRVVVGNDSRWSTIAAYDYFFSRQSRMVKAEPLVLYGDQKVFQGGVNVARSNLHQYKSRITAFDAKANKKKVVRWLYALVLKKRYTRAALKIQPRWKGALVRLRLRKHRLAMIDDIDIDDFAPVTLEERYTTLPSTEAAESAMALIARSIADGGYALPEPVVPLLPRPAVAVVVAPVPKMASVPSLTRPPVMMDAWLNEQSSMPIVGEVRPPATMQSSIAPSTVTPPQGTQAGAGRGDLEGDAAWGNVMEQFRKRNKNMTKNKYDKVDPMRRYEQQLNRKAVPTMTAPITVPHHHTAHHARAIVSDDCEVTSLSSRSTGTGGIIPHPQGGLRQSFDSRGLLRHSFQSTSSNKKHV